MNIKLIFSDIDGTLIKPKGELSENTKEAIYKLNALKIPFILVSARSPEEMFGYYELLKLNTPIIGYNGGIISEYKDNKLNILESTPISSEEPIIIYDIMKQNFPQLSISIYSETKWYADGIDYGVEIESKLTGIEPVITNIKNLILSGVHIHKIMIIGDCHDIISAEKFLKGQGSFTSSIHRSGEIYLEVTNRHATKVHAMKKIASEYYNISSEYIMAIGDGYNDLDMLKNVKFGIAMGNAPDEIKNSLDYVTKTNLEDGVAHIIDKLVLQK
ncbi:hypothetical protein acsn021_30580 [Anaerocolumna cellulosilytica]|uniref:Uncharacterized protein n=1 Tax=Anaerocolumna cellulosilytica TaxID=433286 RepID=A0A6S6R2C2_9FIRM|nr:Cof-type HAD-IIB family hydrolase [Anaerocolumna cellulosilytica]MBB5197470.1 hypothetical protein [Anaerocolumna cellulosilytica]BCJ95489.1 hypothetical protein acsn021_30580 [Anaerocolumna cellulosilytica]